LNGIKQGKDPPEGIMGGNPIGQVEQFAEPGFFGEALLFDFYPAIGSTDRAANGENQDISQAMPFRALNARVFHIGKDPFQGLYFFHPHFSWLFGSSVSPPHHLDAIALICQCLRRVHTS
jgi:hypothetical protein